MSSNSSEVVPSSSESLGNTDSKLSTKKKQISPAKRWPFVLNNYTDEEISSIVPILKEKCKVWAFSKEVGESGTPHLQGYVEFKLKTRPRSIGCTPRIHWGDKNGKPARGTREENLDYIRKAGPVYMSGGLPEPVRTISYEQMYDWQKEIIEEIEQTPNDRTIVWIWSEQGCLGKTAICKYLTVNYGAICLHGKGHDVRNGISDYVKTQGDTPKIVVVPVPRCKGSTYVSYEALENIKDMYFYSGKFEGGMVCGNPPHLYIFANEPPQTEKLSEDRWVIRNIDRWT